MKFHSTSSRINGLDTLRACAILLVLMYHYMVFVSHEPSFGFLSEIGWMGVDLFFVLSGYLIGNQIFAGLQSEHGFSLKTFYIRRALRTLPNFYVVLAIYFLFPIEAGGKAVTPLWKFLTFTQNFDLKPGSAFSHAWSLSIEEQFYVALPLVAIACMTYLKSVRAMWLVLFAAMAGAAGMRYLMGQQVGDDFTQYYVHIYYSTWCRFDELLPGVALALLLWQRDFFLDLPSALRYAVFNTISVATTLGFATTDYGQWPFFAGLWLLFLCSFATGAGSTGGGIKMMRAILLYKQVYRELQKLIHPNAQIPLRLGDEIVPNKVVYAVLAFLFIYVAAIVSLSFVLSFTGLDVLTSFSAIVACINNTGPGLGQVGPATTYAVLSDFQVSVCTFAMLLGRLELFTLLVVLTPAFWRR